MMKMSDCWPKSKAIALVLCSKITQKLPTLTLIDCHSRLTRDENERFWPKRKAIALVSCSNMTQK